MSEPSQTSAIAGEAIVGLTTTGVEVDPTMPDYNADHFEWEGACWDLVSDPDLDIALVLPGGNSGLQEEFAARLANILRLNVENLYVTDTAVINEAVINRLFADMFTANKIGADQIAANSIDVSKLRVTEEMSAAIGNFLEINAEQVTGGSFSGKTFVGGEFEGAVIIGGSIATTRYPSSDGGIHLATSTGLRGWDSKGNLTFRLRSDTGEVSIAAPFKAMNSQNRGVILFPTTTAGGGGLWFTDDGTGSSSAASIWRSNYDPNSAEPLNIRGANGGHVNVQGGLQVTRGGVTSEYGISILNRGQDFYTEGGLTVRRPGSTSASANTVIESDGAVRLRSSSRRYKKNIVNWSPDAERVLALRPRQWQHDDPSRPDIIDERWHVGFVAEEVHDLGLKGLVAYSGDGAGGWRPEALNYDRFAAAHQVVLQKHEARIAELEAKIEEITNGN